MWDQVAEDRWVIPIWTDNAGTVSDRHFLLHAGTSMNELHGTTVHRYAVTGAVEPADPLAAATWRVTIEHAPVPDGDGDDVWQALDEIAAQPLPPAGGTPTA